jgi:hypothetical protein
MRVSATRSLARRVVTITSSYRRWLVRQAMREGVHYLGDIRRIGGISG